jgi:predicted ATPase
MAIERIKVSNFRSFRDLDLELRPLTVLIGPNAAGKSNLVQVFRFLRDIARDGLENAIALQGGVEYLRNVQLGADRPLTVEIVSTQEGNFVFPSLDPAIPGSQRAAVQRLIYQFALRFGKKAGEFAITEDKVTLECEWFERVDAQQREKKLGAGRLIATNTGGQVSVTACLGDAPLEPWHFSPALRTQRLPPKTLLLEAAPLFPLYQYLSVSLAKPGDLRLALYDFDPKHLKRGIVAGKSELEEDGSNLAIVVKKILAKKSDKASLINLVRDLLPFVSDLAVERTFDHSLQLKLREKYSPGFWPAFLLSDGTVSVVALIVALFFEEKPFLLIEEPERYIHPYRIANLVSLLKEAAEKRQIIVTTHSPELVNQVGVEDLLLLSRDKEGFSSVSRPAEKERVKRFLEHDLGVGELFIENLLGV